MATTFVKGDDEVLDYVIDWRDRLEEDETIVNTEWDIEDKGNNNDLVEAPKGQTTQNGKSQIWLEAGVPHETYSVEQTIETSEDRTYETYFEVRIVEID